jgi:tetratricopeptide (TPR) repeat protein
MSIQLPDRAQTELGENERVLIAITTDTRPPEGAIRRVGTWAKLRDLTLPFVVEQALTSHEQLKRFGGVAQYEAEQETIHEVARIRSGSHRCFVNEMLVEPERLASVRVRDLLSQVSDAVARYGVCVILREMLLAQPTVAAEIEPSVAPEEIAEPEARPEAPRLEADVSRAGPAPAEKAAKREYASKHDLLVAEYREAVADLNFDGVFVNNLRATNEFDPRVISFMHQKEISKLLMRANRLLQDGFYERAVEVYGMLAGGEQENPDYLFLYGKALLFAQQWERALAVLAQAQALGQESAGSVRRKVEGWRSAVGGYPVSPEALRNLLGELVRASG